MTENETKHASKFLSLVLRHEPERVGLSLGDAGWIGVDESLRAVNQHGISLTLDQLKHIVATSDKKRFAFSEDGLRIRASQGHSVEVDLQYEPQEPPGLLYHGTATRFLDSIRQNGLLRMERHDVHLAAETKVTLQAGGRHGHSGRRDAQGRPRFSSIGQWRLACESCPATIHRIPGKRTPDSKMI
jgi:putative RNA 2'-phosphotransferase